MIKVTCIWCILSLLLVYRASCSKNIQCAYSSLLNLARTSRSRSVLVGVPPIQQHRQQRQVAFVSGCKVTFDTTSDRKLIITAATSSNNNSNKASPQKTMDFLKRIGKVGNAVTDTECLIGVDEGNAGGCTSSTTSTTSTGKNEKVPEKQQVLSSHFRSCVDTGIIDDMTNEFPYTNTGSRWGVFTYVFSNSLTAMTLPFIRFQMLNNAITFPFILQHSIVKSDQVMGGISTGNISRELHYHGRNANVLRGEVRLDNNGGFIQMATNFVPVDANTADGASFQSNSFRTATPIDASKFTGIELDVHCDVDDTFNVQYVCIYISKHNRRSFLFDQNFSYAIFFSVTKLKINGLWTTTNIVSC